MSLRLVIASTTLLYGMAVGCGGRNLDAGPEPIVVIVDDDGDGGSTSDGTGGFGGLGPGGGGGVSVGGQGGMGNGGGGGIMPVECLTCIGQECPSAIDCVTDPGCVQGVVCAVSDCLGGGGQPDLMCVVGCFDGDFEAALAAVDALTCIAGSCSDACGDLIPLP
jgi:hypothetical protein